MGLYLLNISVDSADPYPDYVPEDLSINDQESIVEIVLEKILGYDNAIEENDDNDTEDHNKKTITKIDLIPRIAVDSSLTSVESTKLKVCYHQSYLTNGFHKLDTPPPKI